MRRARRRSTLWSPGWDTGTRVSWLSFHFALWLKNFVLVPVKSGGKWLPVENVFSTLQDVWQEAERLGRNKTDVNISSFL